MAVDQSRVAQVTHLYPASEPDQESIDIRKDYAEDADGGFDNVLKLVRAVLENGATYVVIDRDKHTRIV